MTRHHARGFTLVEMLVAITVMAVLGLISWRGLEQLLAQRARLDASNGGTEQLVRVLSQFERDLAQRVPDALVARRALPGSPLPLAVDIDTDASGQPRIRVLRQRGGGAGTVSVLWSIESGVLVRTATAATAAVADRVALLDAVSAVRVRLLLADGWVDTRDMIRTDSVLPERGSAVEFTIDRGSAGRFTRVLAL